MPPQQRSLAIAAEILHCSVTFRVARRNVRARGAQTDLRCSFSLSSLCFCTLKVLTEAACYETHRTTHHTSHFPRPHSHSQALIPTRAETKSVRVQSNCNVHWAHKPQAQGPIPVLNRQPAHIFLPSSLRIIHHHQAMRLEASPPTTTRN
jgi:hypothetical protein